MITINSVRRGVSLWGIPGWFADIDAGTASMSVSRLDDEEHWYVDSLFSGSFPHFVHGEGDRSVLKQRLSPDSKVVEDLDRKAGLLVANKGLQLDLFCNQ